MDEKKFCNWLLAEFGFNCFENDFIEKTLLAVKEEIDGSKVGGVAYPDYYPLEELYQIARRRFLWRLKLHLQQIPPPTHATSLIFQGIDLSAYSHRKEEIQYLIRKLEI